MFDEFDFSFFEWSGIRAIVKILVPFLMMVVPASVCVKLVLFEGADE